MIEISTEDADRVCAVIRKLLEAENRSYEEGIKKLPELEAEKDKLKNTSFGDFAEHLMKKTVKEIRNKHLKCKAELEFVLSLMYTGSEKKA